MALIIQKTFTGDETFSIFNRSEYSIIRSVDLVGVGTITVWPALDQYTKIDVPDPYVRQSTDVLCGFFADARSTHIVEISGVSGSLTLKIEVNG